MKIVRSHISPYESQVILGFYNTWWLSVVFLQVLVDEKKVTEGVEVEYEGISESIEVNKEVIVSAGAIGTPQLLLLSGIGPAQELRKHKVH